MPPPRRSSVRWRPHVAPASSCRTIQGHRSRRCAPSADRRYPGPDPTPAIRWESPRRSARACRPSASRIPCRSFSPLAPERSPKPPCVGDRCRPPPAHCLRPHEQRPSMRPCPPHLSRSYAVPCQSPYVVIHMRHMPHASTVRNIRTPAQTNPANVVEGSPASIDPHRLPLTVARNSSACRTVRRTTSYHRALWITIPQ